MLSSGDSSGSSSSARWPLSLYTIEAGPLDNNVSKAWETIIR